MSEITPILTTYGREKRAVGHQFSAHNLSGDHQIGELFPVRNWEDVVYGLAKIISTKNNGYELEIIKVWL